MAPRCRPLATPCDTNFHSWYEWVHMFIYQWVRYLSSLSPSNQNDTAQHAAGWYRYLGQVLVSQAGVTTESQENLDSYAGSLTGFGFPRKRLKHRVGEPLFPFLFLSFSSNSSRLSQICFLLSQLLILLSKLALLRALSLFHFSSIYVSSSSSHSSSSLVSSRGVDLYIISEDGYEQSVESQKVPHLQRQQETRRMTRCSFFFLTHTRYQCQMKHLYKYCILIIIITHVLYPLIIFIYA